MSNALRGLWAGLSRPRRSALGTVSLGVVLAACGAPADARSPALDSDTATATPERTAAATDDTDTDDVTRRLERYAPTNLAPDLEHLEPGDRSAIRLLIQAARQMDEVFWIQASGDADSLPAHLDDAERRLFALNYGPWDRLEKNVPFLAGFDPKPAGANLYPEGTTRGDVESAAQAGKRRLLDPYSRVHSDDRAGLRSVAYHIEFRGQHDVAASMLEEAAKLVSEEALKTYLQLRGQALKTDRYAASDSAWVELEQNAIDIRLGPTGMNEDRLMGVKAVHSGQVMLRNTGWQARLDRFRELLPRLRRNLTVLDGVDSDTRGPARRLDVFDLLFASGAANAGVKEESVDVSVTVGPVGAPTEAHADGGTPGAAPAGEAPESNAPASVRERRVLLRNVQAAHFDQVFRPITDVLIDPEQRALVDFEVVFTHRVLHEVAHDLGPRVTTETSTPVRQALRAYHEPIDEAKADVLALLLAGELIDGGELEQSLAAYQVAYLASLIHSARADAINPKGQARMVQLAYLTEQEVVLRDDTAGTYRVDLERMEEATRELALLLIGLQADGNISGAGRVLAERGVVPSSLSADLAMPAFQGLPEAAAFNQGWNVLTGR